jgi:2-dehydro-3-deoxy-D-gluconate 5-dehydrogenase
MSYLDDLFGLGGQTAVVTGAPAGWARPARLALARAGARVILAGRDRERGERVLAEIATAGGEAELDLVDVSDAGEAGAFADRVLAGHDRIDILVNAAGVFIRGDAVDVPIEQWESLMRTNVNSTFLLCQRFGQAMIGQGRGKEAIPAGRVGQPDEIVGAVRFLASGASDMFAGHNLLADGGRTVI